MKRLRLLPSILMLVLCIGVLAVGIYAVSPVTHSVVGTISVAAAGAKVNMGVYYDATNNGISADDTLISNELNTRAGDALSIDEEKAKTYLDFTHANYDSGITTKNLYIKIENQSSRILGAYFLVGEVGDDGATLENIASVSHLDSKDGTISDLIKCTFGTYTKIAQNEIVGIDLDITLLKEVWDGTQAELNLTLNIEEYNENIAPLENGVNVYTNGTNVSLATKTTHGLVEDAQEADEINLTKVKDYRYSVAGVKLDETNYPSEWAENIKKHETTKLAFTITNNGSTPISADISTNFTRAGVEVIEIGNAYIPAKTGDIAGEGEISLQLAISDGATIDNYFLNDLNCRIDIYEATEDIKAQANIQGRIQKSDTAVDGMEYFIEYGINPYKNNEPLRWFIWAKEEEGEDAGKAVALAENEDPTAESSRGTTYYFISEYALEDGFAFQNMGYMPNEDNKDEFNLYYYTSKTEEDTDSNSFAVADYAGSNLRNYFNGLTVKKEYNYNYSYNPKIASGDLVNFYSTFQLTNDPIYSKIEARQINELYSTNAEKLANPAAMFDDSADKFWALSDSEAEMVWCSSTKLVNGYDVLSFWLRSSYLSPTACVRCWGVAVGGLEYFEASDCAMVSALPAFKLSV